jgi:hypothetical protein
LRGRFEQSYYLVAAEGKKNSCMKERPIIFHFQQLGVYVELESEPD